MTQRSTDLSAFDPRYELGRLWRRWREIVASAVLASVLGFGAAFLFPSVYESELNIMFGRLQGEPLENPYSVSALLGSAGFRSQLPAADQALGSNLLSVEIISSPGERTPDLLRITARGSTAEDAVKAAKVIAEAVINRHRPIYDSAVLEAEQYQTTLERRIELMNEEVAEMQRSVERRGLGRDDTAISMSMLIQDRQLQILALARELRDLRAKEAASTRPTAIVGTPTVPSAPGWPNPAVFAAVAGALGFAIAVAVVLLAPIASPSWKEIQPPASATEPTERLARKG